MNDARQVAAALDIPFKVFDFEKQYRDKVVNYMVAEYQSGRTPNPDIMCNQEIKFRLFLDTALADGADLIATGHYAQVKDGKLYKGVDETKDQSYFLYRISPEALTKTLMPIGELKKTMVRKLARQFNLLTADKPDSQGICFIGEVSVRDFLADKVTHREGDVMLGGKVIGRHAGAVFYTIGQRHGLGIGTGKPLYVTGKDMESNTVFVTDIAQDLSLFAKEFEIEDSHWLELPKAGKAYQVHTRYRDRLKNCQITSKNSAYSVKMERSERAITPGQSAVIYDGNQVIGGGVIVAKALALSLS